MIQRVPHIRWQPMSMLLRMIAVLIIGVCFAQDVYLRLTDYGGGKIGIYIQPFTSEQTSADATTKVRNIETVIENDLEYSLYFDILADTAEFAGADEGVILQAHETGGQLKTVLLDYASKEQIAHQEYQIGDFGCN